MHHHPLVSIVVITYNSSQTVLETLESIKNQTYPEIELIVSDDCSPDNTLELVRDWMHDNVSRFIRSEIVASDRNTGVSANMNRGGIQARGKWIKTIAGDDCLVPECIEVFVSFVENHNEPVRMCVSDVEPFSDNGDVPKGLIDTYALFLNLEKEPYEQQRKRVMTELVFVGPGYFFSKDLFSDVGGYSEKYGNAEEWPFVYKVIMGGDRIYVLDKKLVRYRYSEKSLCHNREKQGLRNRSVFIGMYRHFFDIAFKDLIRDGRPFTAWHYALSYWGQRMQYHIRNPFLWKLVDFGTLALSPLAYVRKLKSCFHKQRQNDE